ncbi:MAG: MFS transporter [Ilumatobacteraceae bacterium]
MGRRMILSFCVLCALFAAGYGVMFTLLDDFRDRYGISDASLGGVVAVGFFASFAAQVLFAPLADRGHARRLVYVGMALNIIGVLAMGFGRDVLVLGGGRMVMGLGAGMALPAIRRIVILADPAHLGHNVGLLLAADVTGFALGPAISAVLVGPFGLAAPFLVIVAATVACLPLIGRVRVGERDDAAGAVEPARFAFDLLRVRPYVGALCFGAAAFVMIGTFDSLWVLVLDDLHTADWIANLGITLFALPLIVLGSPGGRLSQRHGPFKVGTIGLLLGATFMLLYGQLPSGAAMFAAAMIHSLSDGLTVSASGVAVGLVAPAARQAGAQGLLGGTQTLVGGMCALLAGQLYGHFGRGWAYTVCAALMVTLVVVGRRFARGAALGTPHPSPAPADLVPS